MHPVLRIGILLRRVGKIETRKKFQKIVHILQVMGAPFPESFDLNLYGAYSADLRAELDAFSDEELVDESGDNSPGYTLRPTEKLLGLLGESPALPDPDWVDWAEELNKRSPSDLEGISTILYLFQRRWPENTWAHRFAQLKPHLSTEYKHFETEAKRLLCLCSASQAAVK